MRVLCQQCIILPGTWWKLVFPGHVGRLLVGFLKHPSLQISPLNLVKMLSKYRLILFFKQSNLTGLSKDGFVSFGWEHLACHYFFPQLPFEFKWSSPWFYFQSQIQCNSSLSKGFLKLFFLHGVSFPLDSACLTATCCKTLWKADINQVTA